MVDSIMRLPNEQEQNNICRRFAVLLRKNIIELEAEVLDELSNLDTSSDEWVVIKKFLDGPLVIAKNSSRIRIFVTTSNLAKQLSCILRDGIPEKPLCFEVCLGTLPYQGHNLTVHIGAFGALCSKAAQVMIRRDKTN